MKTTFKANVGWQEMGLNGIFTAVPAESTKGVSAFCKKVEERSQKTGKSYMVNVTLEVWYKKRSISQLRLHWQLCNRLAAVDGQDPEVVHEAIRTLYYPRMTVDGVDIIKPSKLHTTKEFAEVTERLIQECLESGADVKDLWIVWSDWLYSQERNPLQYKSKDEYKEKHPCCEACGAYLQGDMYNKGHGELAHIVSRGAGGSNSFDNLLHLCQVCHREIQHQHGWDKLIETYPHLTGTVERARHGHTE